MLQQPCTPVDCDSFDINVFNNTEDCNLAIGLMEKTFALNQPSQQALSWAPMFFLMRLEPTHNGTPLLELASIQIFWTTTRSFISILQFTFGFLCDDILKMRDATKDFICSNAFIVLFWVCQCYLPLKMTTLQRQQQQQVNSIHPRGLLRRDKTTTNIAAFH